MHRVVCIDMLNAMSEKHERLRQAREKAGFRYASEAANSLGITASTYRAHENGQNDFGMDEAIVYGKKFNVDPVWLVAHHIQALSERHTDEAGNIVTLTPEEHRRIHLPNGHVGDRIVGAGRMIPVYGQAVGGVNGEFEMNGNKLFDVMAPPVLSDVSKAYAVSVSGESMWPRYEDGEICFVDPTRRVKKNDYVIAQIRSGGHGAPLAYVKRFVRWNSEELVLEQFNPAEMLKFPAQDVVSVHYIALAGNA